MEDSQSEYAKDTVVGLIELFQTNFGDVFKSYWEATPTSQPPDVDFPLVIVQKMSGKATLGPTSTDDDTETIVITVMLNMADDIGSANVRTTTMRHLQNLIEGQDPSTNQYKTGTFFYILRTYLTLLQSSGNIWLIDSDISVKYDQVPRKDMPAISIADITMTTQRRVIVSNRQ